MKKLALYAEVFSVGVASGHAICQRWNEAYFLMLFAILFSIVYLRQCMTKED
jgi:hypothetical protein